MQAGRGPGAEQEALGLSFNLALNGFTDVCPLGNPD